MTRQTMVQLTDDLVARLDEVAAQQHLSRSAVVRSAVEAHLQRVEQDTVGRRIVEGYTRIPPASPDEWGGVAEAADAAVREVMQRLATEERSAGLDPW